MPGTEYLSMRSTRPESFIQIQQLNECIHIQSNNLFPTGRKVFEILFISSGSGHCIMNGIPVTFEPSSIHTGYAGCFQNIRIDGSTEGYLICICPQKIEIDLDTPDLINEDLSLIDELSIQLEPETAGDLHWVISRLWKHCTNEHTLNRRLINKYLTLLLLLIRTQSDAGTASFPMNSKSLLLKNFFFLLEKNFCIHKTVDHYAALLCVSAKYLTNVMKSESGYPTSYHINQRIIREATKMIRHSGASLKVVAYALGFDDVAVFSKLFKRITGITFKEYKYNLKIDVSRLRQQVPE